MKINARILALVVAGTIGLAALPAAAQTSPATGTSTTSASTGIYPGLSALQSQNLDTALQFMENMGNQAEADNIRAHAETGNISADQLGSGVSGETSSVTGHITLSDSTIAPFTRFRNQPPLDGENPAHLTEIASLADTLIHEFTHSGQSYGEWTTSQWAETAGYGNASELEAWSNGLGALESWIQSFRDDLRDAQERGAHPDEIARLARAVRDLALLYQTLRSDFEKLNYGTITWRADDGTHLGFNATDQWLVQLIGDVETIMAGASNSTASSSTSNLADDVADAIAELEVATAITAVSTGQKFGIGIRTELDLQGVNQGLDQGSEPQSASPIVTAPSFSFTITAGPSSR